jgi:NarL family two-component system response regulator LiaR
MSQANPIRVMIVDDHAMVRGGLRLFLSTQDDIEVVAEADDGREAVALCAQAQPDVILMDLVMPGVDGPTATAQIRQAHPQIQVIALTSFLEKDLVHDALQAGAISYLLKDVDANRLAEAVRAACRGQVTLSSSVAQMLVQEASGPPEPDYELTERELEILALLVKGQTNKEIATCLALSPGTVRIYVSTILSKLGVRNRTEAASLALQHNLVPVDD